MTIRVRTSIAKLPASWDMGFHEHPEWEISAVFHGRGYFGTDVRIPLYAGSVVLIPPNLPHEFGTDKGIEFGILHGEGLTGALLDDFQPLLHGAQAQVVHFTPSDLQLYQSMFRDWLRSVSRSDGPSRQALLAAWLRLLMTYVVHQSKATDFPRSVESAAAYIDANLHLDLRMAEVANHFGMGTSTFRRVFQKTYGLSPKQYHHKCRLEESSWLLRTTDLPVHEVATAVGFESLHGFSAWFASQMGQSPSQWRSAQQTGSLVEV